MSLSRPSLSVLVVAALGAGLPACLLDASAYDGATGPAGGAGGGTTTTGAGAGDTGTTGTAGGHSGGTGGAGATGGGGAGATGGGGGTGGSPVVPGDACPGTPVMIAVYTEVLIDGDTTDAHDDYGSSVCGGGDAPEIIYEVTPLAKGILTATLEPATGFAGFVQLRAKCSDGTTEKDCGTTAKMDVLANTPVYVFVDGHANDPGGAPAGAFKLRLSLNGCSNGTIESGSEECDDGNLVEDDTCTAECKVRCTRDGSVATGADLFVHPTTHHCYMQAYDPNRKWDEARNDCVAWGGTLAALTTTEEIADLSGLLAGTGEDIWIGGDDMAMDGSFVWQTGEPWTFTNGQAPWQENGIGADEPNGGGGENCVEIYKSGKLNDENCSAQQNWMCERPPAGETAAQ